MDRKKEEFIISKYRDRIYYFALRKLGNTESARDITQDTIFAFLEITKNGKVRNPDKLSSLIYGILKNKISDYFKLKAKEKIIQKEISYSIREELNIPLSNLAVKKEKEKIKKVLLKLKPLDREILYIYFNEDKTSQEIASILGLSPHYVSVRKWRAIKKIKKWIR